MNTGQPLCDEQSAGPWRPVPSGARRNPEPKRGVGPRVAFVTQPLWKQAPALSRPSPARAPALAPGTVDPDRELVDRWQAGDIQAFESLIRRHERRVFGLLLRMLGSVEEAQDVAQEAFLNLHRHGHRFRSQSRFSTFLYRVAVNAALNRRRSLGRRRARTEALERRQEAGDDLPSSPRNPEDAASGGEIQERVQNAILTLPPHLRVPLVLFDIEGCSYSDVANVLQVAEGTVKSRIHRARQALRERLRDLVDDPASLRERAQETPR
jgi:RNA polymerase sigma-70 factor (ECF subfamily)